MDYRDSYCLNLHSGETTVKGTGLTKFAGKEDPEEKKNQRGQKSLKKKPFFSYWRGISNGR
jgi:hypothetical protein